MVCVNPKLELYPKNAYLLQIVASVAVASQPAGSVDHLLDQMVHQDRVMLKV